MYFLEVSLNGFAQIVGCFLNVLELTLDILGIALDILEVAVDILEIALDIVQIAPNILEVALDTLIETALAFDKQKGLCLSLTYIPLFCMHSHYHFLSLLTHCSLTRRRGMQLQECCKESEAIGHS